MTSNKTRRPRMSLTLGLFALITTSLVGCLDDECTGAAGDECFSGGIVEGTTDCDAHCWDVMDLDGTTDDPLCPPDDPLCPPDTSALDVLSASPVTTSTPIGPNTACAAAVPASPTLARTSSENTSRKPTQRIR